MGSFGTGLPPGAHGLVGYEVLDPDRDVLLNELSWEPAVDPREWQPKPTVFERLDAAGVPVTRIGPGYFDGSGLTESALRGGAFVGADSFARGSTRRSPRAARRRAGLVYVYWGDLDKVGHVHGCVLGVGRGARAGRQAAAGWPSGCPPTPRCTSPPTTAWSTSPWTTGSTWPTSPSWRPACGTAAASRGRCTSTASRARPPTCSPPGERLAGRAWVRTRAEAVAQGWFGAVVAAGAGPDRRRRRRHRGRVAVVDSRHQRPQLLALIGLHGSLTRRGDRRARCCRCSAARSADVAELVFFSGTMDCGKSTLALQTDHNHAARGRAGWSSPSSTARATALSQPAGPVGRAIEVADELDFWDWSSTGARRVSRSTT